MTDRNSLRSLAVVSFLFTGIILIPIRGLSQISIQNVEEAYRVRSGTTYVVVNDPESPQSQEYMDSYKKYWTLSKVEFIQYNDIIKYEAENSSFFLLTKETNVYSSATTVHWYLELVVCKPSKKKNTPSMEKIQIARVELFPASGMMMGTEPFLIAYDAEERIRNLGSGTLKNYLQLLVENLNPPKERLLTAKTSNDLKLKDLKSQTLYVPDYVLIKFNSFSGDESKKLDEKDIFEDYKFAYKILPFKELNEKILQNETSFYYLLYVKSSAWKFITIYESSTGEIVYSNFDIASYNIKSDDMKEISNKIKKLN